MTRRYGFTTIAMMLAVALSLTLPAIASAKEGHGKQGRGRSSEAREHPGRGHGRGGKHAVSRRVQAHEGGERRGSGEVRARSYDGGSYREPRQSTRLHDLRRDYQRGTTRTYQRGSTRTYQRDGVRSGSRRGEWSGRSYDTYRRSHDGRGDRYRDGGRSHTTYRYRDGGRSYGGHYSGRRYASHHRPYYYGSFNRPRYVRSSFSIGFVFGSAPAYRYRYFDPYCDVSYVDLGGYYDHCSSHDHPEVIVIMDYDSGHPMASCVWDDGAWVVDDCY
jgi:hypothetical protein